MGISNIIQLGFKELRGLSRDHILIVLIIYTFTLNVYIATTAIPDTLNKAPISIVDEDVSPLSARIASAFYPPRFTVPQVISASEVDRRMDAGLDTFALDIPPNFQRDLLAGRSPEIQVSVDATRMIQAFNGSGYVQNIVSDEVTAFLQRYRSTSSLPVELVLRSRFNTELSRPWFQAIVDLIDSITILSVILTGAALIREREHGTTEHLLVMPVSPAEIMVSKIWSMGSVVLLVSSLSITVVIEGFLEVPINGSIALFLVGIALHLFATTSMGIFLATIAGSMPQFGLLLILVLLPLEVLSGGLTPRESMPLLVQDLMLAAPNTHFVMLAQSILFRGAGIEVVWPQFAALFGIGAALFTFALGRFRKSLK